MSEGVTLWKGSKRHVQGELVTHILNPVSAVSELVTHISKVIFEERDILAAIHINQLRVTMKPNETLIKVDKANGRSNKRLAQIMR